MTSLQSIPQVVVIGIGATAFMDGWLSILRKFGVPTLDFAMIGRWLGHLLRGTFSHPAIAKSQPVRGELALGWITHYAVGIAFAGVLVCSQGAGWMSDPSLAPAVVVGVLTVALPLFVMQPAMGAGLAASRTPTPLKNCVRSVANHTVFGLGLYLSAVIFAWICQ